MGKLGTVTGKLRLDDSWSPAAFLKDFRAAQDAALFDVKAFAQEIVKVTVGTQYYSLTALRQMGHPYSVTNPMPPMPPGVINMQSGGFYQSLHWLDPRPSGLGSATIQFFSDDEAKSGWLVGGEGRMMPRPYDALLRQRIYRGITSQLDAAIRKYARVKFVGA